MTHEVLIRQLRNDCERMRAIKINNSATRNRSAMIAVNLVNEARK